MQTREHFNEALTHAVFCVCGNQIGFMIIRFNRNFFVRGRIGTVRIKNVEHRRRRHLIGPSWRNELVPSLRCLMSLIKSFFVVVVLRL